MRDRLCALHTWYHYTYYHYWPVFMTLDNGHRWKARGFSSVCKTMVASNWLDFLFVNSEPSGAICRAWALKTTGARGRACMKRNMYRNKKMHIFIHGNTVTGKNERPGAALQGNCASDSWTRQKFEYFLRRIYLCQLTVLTSISSLESYQWSAPFHPRRENII